MSRHPANSSPIRSLYVNHLYLKTIRARRSSKAFKNLKYPTHWSAHIRTPELSYPEPSA